MDHCQEHVKVRCVISSEEMLMELTFVSERHQLEFGRTRLRSAPQTTKGGLEMRQ